MPKKTQTFKLIDKALTFATFKNDDVEKDLKKLLIIVDSELNSAGYEEGAPIEDAMEELNETIDETEPDEDEEVVKVVDEDDDEIMGLDDDDDDEDEEEILDEEDE